jgi:hypothetical protein
MNKIHMIFIYPDYRVDPIKKWKSYTFELLKVHIVRFYKLTTGIVCFRKIYVVKDNPEPVKAYCRLPFLRQIQGKQKSKSR